MPTELGQLKKLELVQLHGNRISGVVPRDLNVGESLPQDEKTSSFITDCGLPTDFDDPLECKECTMCCNSAGDCHSTEKPRLEQFEAKGFDSYAELIWVFLLLQFGCVCLIVLASYIYDKSPSMSEREGRSMFIRDKNYALETDNWRGFSLPFLHDKQKASLGSRCGCHGRANSCTCHVC